MKAKVIIDKSFDDSKEFTKVWNEDDFRQFLNDEGAYLDRLAKVLEERGNENDGFTVTYTVSLTK